MRVLLLLPLIGCATTPPPEPSYFCTTPCGAIIVAQNGTPQYTCDEYGFVESLLVGEIRDQFPNACYDFKGVLVWETPGWSTFLLPDREVSGWAECWLSRVHVHVNDGFADKEKTQKVGLAHTAYAHEMIHIAQACMAPLPIDDKSDADHSNWYRDGLFQAIWNVYDKAR